MRIILSILGIVLSFFMLRYRERIGETIGEANWMQKIGGVYNFIIICAVLLFFWSIAELTGTTNIFFKPLLLLFPSMGGNGGEDFVIE